MGKISTFLLVIITTLSAGSGVSAQMQNFTWEDGLCSYRGLYDPKKYSEAELKNTLRLFEQGEFSLVGHADTVFKYEDIERIDIEKFDKKYREMNAELKALKIVKVPFFQSLRDSLLKEMEQVWQLNRTTMTAFRNPRVLNDYSRAPKCNDKYAAPLIGGGDDLINVWLDVNMDSRSKNSDPDRLKREFEAQKASPDKYKFALVEVMTFGWYNCANDSIEYVPSDGKASEEFQKLFTRPRGHCDEP